MKKRSCTAFLAACALAVFAGSARGEDEADEQKVTVSLAEVRAFPEAYRRVSFDVELLYHGPRSIYNPFFTVFEPSNYANFSAWSGDAAIFRRDEYCDDHPLFYVERRNQALQRQMMSLRPYTWMVARCIVRGVAQDKAWIEVLSIPTIGATLDPVDLRHLVRGHALGQSGEIERAMVELGMARLFQVPPRFVARCRLEEGRLALAGNQPERALVALQQAWTQLPEDKQLTKLIDRASAQVAMLRQGEINGTTGTTPTPPQAPPAQKPATSDGQSPAWVPQADGPAAPKSTTPAAEPAAPAKETTPAWTPKDEAQPATPKSTTPAEPQAPAKESNPEWTPKDEAAPATPKSTTPPAEVPTQKPAQEPWVPADQAAPPAAKPAEATPAAKPTETPAPKPAQEPWVPADQAAPPAAKPTETIPAAKPTDAPAEKPADKPADKPAETPAEKPVDAPSEKPVDAPPADEPVGPPPSDDEVPPPVTPDPSDDGDDGSGGG